MPLIHAISTATTTPGTPRDSATVNYSGTSDKQVIVKVLCPTWATADPAVTVTVEVQQSFDGETTWEDFAELIISPPQTNRHGEIPYMGCQCTDNRGIRAMRVRLSTTGGPLVCGVDITV
jgi:hypothetical protein